MSALTKSPALNCRDDVYDTDIKSKVRNSMALPTKSSRVAQVEWANDFPEDFEILAKVGEGTFSTVWAASEKSADQSHGSGGKKGLVALKRIHPTCSPTRILNEFEQMRKLGGRCNVVQAKGVLRTPGGVFVIAMPFFEHDEFRHYMKSFTLAGVAAYTRSLLTALRHVHAAGVIHRDIKPRNFMYNAKARKGMLIDFGLAEPAEKWKDRCEALAKHRDRRALRKKPRAGECIAAGRNHECPGGTTVGRDGAGGPLTRLIGDASERGAGDVIGPAESPREDRLKLLRKVERGGTTGFRAPEVLWHSRDQRPAVDVWSAGVILLCLLSRRYPVFPSADNDEMALVQVAAVVGIDEVVEAARRSGWCNIVELPSLQRRGALERLCAPLLGGPASDELENRPRADALCLLRGMLKVDPAERLSAKDALAHPFLLEGVKTEMRLPAC